jgi:ABC-2 type transport system permease protein
MLLAGVFYSTDSLPAVVRPIAEALPLSFVASGFRQIIIDGASLFDLLPQLLGLLVWGVVTLLLAIRLFKWKQVAG